MAWRHVLRTIAAGAGRAGGGLKLLFSEDWGYGVTPFDNKLFGESWGYADPDIDNNVFNEAWSS